MGCWLVGGVRACGGDGFLTLWHSIRIRTPIRPSPLLFAAAQSVSLTYRFGVVRFGSVRFGSGSYPIRKVIPHEAGPTLLVSVFFRSCF